jgi:putative Mg2+ transporter-C (MgtC) family protein
MDIYEDLDVLLRLVAAVAVGLVVGLNRDMQQKQLGMRTLAMVSLGAAVVTISTMEYVDYAQDAESRVLQGIIQGVLTGIGFIGAGVILHDTRAQEIYGLTTAATVWVTAALGIACGLGAWPPVIAGVILSIAVLYGLGKLEAHFIPGKPDKSGKPRKR